LGYLAWYSAAKRTRAASQSDRRAAYIPGNTKAMSRGSERRRFGK
jgi:hypothetical protein